MSIEQLFKEYERVVRSVGKGRIVTVYVRDRKIVVH